MSFFSNLLDPHANLTFMDLMATFVARMIDKQLVHSLGWALDFVNVRNCSRGVG